MRLLPWLVVACVLAGCHNRQQQAERREVSLETPVPEARIASRAPGEGPTHLNLMAATPAPATAEPSVAASLEAAASAPVDTSADQAALQGTWKLDACTVNGQSQGGDVQWVVNGDRYTVQYQGARQLWSYKLGAGQTVSATKIGAAGAPPDGMNASSLSGIYKLDGPGSLWVCYDMAGSKAPDAFEAPAGSRRVLYHFTK